ncbi:MAG: redoxin domain-containing protein [Verrucomicrobia bacterium]|nr:redoxin domain-containing protein [Verrucomicrobiota bacterium]
MKPKINHALLTIVLSATILLPGCGTKQSHNEDSGKTALDLPTNVTAYQVKGVLREIRAEGWKALIAHEDIPGYMEAMTMLLDVRNTNELANLQPGDQITFRMLVTDTDGWIDHVERTGVTNAPVAAPPPVVKVEELKTGAVLPDYTLTNQLGQAIRLSEFKGRALAFTFIFTRCPFPTFCPRMNNNFAEVQKLMSQRQAGTNWHLLSISFDPEFDTPERMAIHSQSYHPDPTRWSFATAADETIRKLGGMFGLAYARDGALFSHNVRTVVVDVQGRVQTVFNNNEWKPSELMDALEAAMKQQP